MMHLTTKTNKIKPNKFNLKIKSYIKNYKINNDYMCTTRPKSLVERSSRNVEYKKYK